MFAFAVKLKSSAATVKPVFSELNNINTARLAASHSPFGAYQHIAFEIPALGPCIAFGKLFSHSCVPGVLSVTAKDNRARRLCQLICAIFLIILNQQPVLELLLVLGQEPIRIQQAHRLVQPSRR